MPANPTTGGVLLVGPLPPPPRLGGVETGVAMLLGSPLARLLPIHLFNTARKEDPSRPLVSRVAYQVQMLCRFACAVARQRPDVVHVKTSAGINYFQNVGYALTARLLGRKVALQIHDGRFPEFLAASSGVLARIIVAALGSPNRIFALSESWRGYFHQLAPRTPIAVVPNGVMSATFANAESARARFGIPAGRVAVLFVGTRDPGLDRRKGLHTLLESFAHVHARHPEAVLVVAGAASADQGAADHRIDVGVVGEADKAALYRSVDLLVLPSEVENMPNTVLEAMAAGIPVVATKVGAVPEMVSHGDTGLLVSVGDVEDLATQIAALLADPDRRVRMGRRAAEAVARTYDFATIEDRLFEEYSALSPRLRDRRATTPGMKGHFGRPRSAVAWHRRPAVQRWWRLLLRLQTMPPAEIAYRIRARLDRDSATQAPLPDLRAVDEAKLTTPRVAGFFNAAERSARVAIVRERRPDLATATVTRGDEILTRGVTLLSKHFRPAEPDFDWLADPDRGRLWPSRSLDDADAVRRVDADVKFVWEVNRHQFLVTLARAYAYSSDERFARAVTAMIRSWLAQNPAGVGVNWSSNLEVAVRGLSWVWALQFLLDTPALAPDDRELWLRALRAHRDHIARHLSIYTDATNHLIGEAAALAVLAMWAPEWEHAGTLRDLAFDVLAKEVEKQVAQDGTDREQATSYQRFVLDLLLQVICVARRTSNTVPPIIPSRASSMLRALSVVINPKVGRAPRIGDSDDARGVPFSTLDWWDFREMLSMGSIALGEAESYSRHHLGYESALWLGGERALDDAPSSATPTPRFAILTDGGYASFTARGGRDRLLFDCGPLGYLPHASHGHADLLSVLVDVDGEEVLIDPGTFAYWDASGRRDLFRSTAMHNTVEIGGWDQADGFDPFKWMNVPASAIEHVRHDENFSYVEAWHDGYRRLRPAVRHRRGVLALGDGGWLIVDWLEGDGAQHFSRRLHAAPECRLHRTSGSVTIATRSLRGMLHVSDLAATASRPELQLESAPYSERYGEATSAPVIAIHEEGTLPLVRALILIPGTTGDPAPLTIEATDIGSDALAITLLEATGSRWDIAARSHAARTRVGTVETDARLAVIRSTSTLTAPDVKVFHGTHAQLCASR